MNGAPLPADAGLPALVVWAGQQLVASGLLTVAGMKTIAGIVSLLTTLCTLASYILKRLTPPKPDAPAGGTRFRILLWRLHVGFYWTVRFLAQASGKAAPVEQPGRAAIMVSTDRHEELSQMVARVVPGSPDQAKP